MFRVFVCRADKPLIRFSNFGSTPTTVFGHFYQKLVAGVHPGEWKIQASGNYMMPGARKQRPKFTY